MSRLQTFLRALPPGSIYTKDLQCDQKAIHASMDRDAALEIADAKEIQSSSDCGWLEAIHLAKVRASE